LSGKGFKQVYNLEGGIRAWNGLKAFGPRELNMDLLRGDEAPAEVSLFAYGMENALGSFYTTLSERTADKALADLFTKLAGIEQRHKEMVFGLYSEVEPSGMDLHEFESKVQSQVMEGGFDIEGFMKDNEPHLKTAPDVLTVGMMIETQALDLYLRYADRSSEVRTKEVLFKIGDEEKAHLTALGELMSEKT
jgi:rubrerythrin